ncbi:MAG TPA: M15 family metallopeptidase [Iamia sp.]|nr:M15 family metallopeptidase [Iamia sp.]
MLVGLAILAVALAAFVVRPSLTASEDDGVIPDRVAVSAPAPWRSSTAVGAPPRQQAALGEADGVIPDGAAVSVFDEETPAVGRLDPGLLAALRRAATDAEADGVGLRVNSGWRSPEHQQQLLLEAVAEYGSPDEAARWVATPETSLHVSGDAVDIGPSEAAAWLSEHGASQGLCRIYGNEPWHFELRPDAVDDGCPPPYADPTDDPRMQP